jgi:hypothetical protein
LATNNATSYQIRARIRRELGDLVGARDDENKAHDLDPKKYPAGANSPPNSRPAQAQSQSGDRDSSKSVSIGDLPKTYGTDSDMKGIN